MDNKQLATCPTPNYDPDLRVIGPDSLVDLGDRPVMLPMAPCCRSTRRVPSSGRTGAFPCRPSPTNARTSNVPTCRVLPSLPGRTLPLGWPDPMGCGLQRPHPDAVHPHGHLPAARCGPAGKLEGEAGGIARCVRARGPGASSPTRPGRWSMWDHPDARHRDQAAHRAPVAGCASMFWTDRASSTRRSRPTRIGCMPSAGAVGGSLPIRADKRSPSCRKVVDPQRFLPFQQDAFQRCML